MEDDFAGKPKITALEQLLALAHAPVKNIEDLRSDDICFNVIEDRGGRYRFSVEFCGDGCSDCSYSGYDAAAAFRAALRTAAERGAKIEVYQGYDDCLNDEAPL